MTVKELKKRLEKAIQDGMKNYKVEKGKVPKTREIILTYDDEKEKFYV